jgi:hypothetical protein
MNFNNRVELHDQVLQYLLNNNYYYFQSPMYLIDKELAPLREVIRRYGNSSPEEYNLYWNAAYETNNFYKQLLRQFSYNIHKVDFINKAGDFIIDINTVWHMIELKTTENENDIYNFNFDSFKAYDSLPTEIRSLIHILFYNSSNNCLWIARFNDLKFQNKCYVYPEIDPQRYNIIRSDNRFYDIEFNNNPNVVPHIDKTQNAYFKIDLHEQQAGVLSTIPEHINKLKVQYNQLQYPTQSIG